MCQIKGKIPKNLVPEHTRHGVDAVTAPDICRNSKYKFCSQFCSGNRKCSVSGCSFEFCIPWKLVVKEAENIGCHDICIPFNARSFYQYESTKYCTEYESLLCMTEAFNNIYDNASWLDCMKPQEIVEFRGTLSNGFRPTFGKSHRLMTFKFDSNVHVIKEEALVYNTLDLIVSVGGSLGLFLGFSFFGYLSCCLDRIVKFLKLKYNFTE